MSQYAKRFVQCDACKAIREIPSYYPRGWLPKGWRHISGAYFEDADVCKGKECKEAGDEFRARVIAECERRVDIWMELARFNIDSHIAAKAFRHMTTGRRGLSAEEAIAEVSRVGYEWTVRSDAPNR